MNFRRSGSGVAWRRPSHLRCDYIEVAKMTVTVNLINRMSPTRLGLGPWSVSYAFLSIR